MTDIDGIPVEAAYIDCRPVKKRKGRYRVVETSSTKPYNGGLIRKYLIIMTNDRGDNKCKVCKGQ